MLQSSWMALRKYGTGLRGWIPAIAHGLVYSLLFTLLTSDWHGEKPSVPNWVMVAIDQAMHLTYFVLRGQVS